MKLIVGLGNPGPEYKNTRHNVGFMVVEELARKLRVTREEHAHHAVIARAEFKGEPLLIMKPLTYMNLSGRAVKDAVRYRKIALSDLIVVLDDLDLEPGRLRLRAKGGSGGHKGLQSIIDELGTDDFARLRIGIGKVPNGETVDYVLSRFAPEEEELIKDTVQRAAEALCVWAASGIDRAMNQYNR